MIILLSLLNIILCLKPLSPIYCSQYFTIFCQSWEQGMRPFYRRSNRWRETAWCLQGHGARLRTLVKVKGFVCQSQFIFFKKELLSFESLSFFFFFFHQSTWRHQRSSNRGLPLPLTVLQSHIQFQNVPSTLGNLRRGCPSHPFPFQCDWSQNSISGRNFQI